MENSNFKLELASPFKTGVLLSAGFILTNILYSIGFKLLMSLILVIVSYI